MGPRSRSIASQAACMAGRSVTSAARPTAWPPAETISCATAEADSPARSSTPTAQPSRGSARAMARPMPRPPPVTTATRTPLRAPGNGRREGSRHRRLALLVRRHALAIDEGLAVDLVAPGDGAGAGDGIARPHAGREAHLVAAEVPRAHEVRQATRHESRGQHAVAEHRGIAGGAGEGLVVVDRVEVAGRARVAHEVRPGEVLDHDGRDRCARHETTAHVLLLDGIGSVDRRMARGGGHLAVLVAIVGLADDEGHRAAAPALLLEHVLGPRAEGEDVAGADGLHVLELLLAVQQALVVELHRAPR